jgi:multicomponent Na+:H+ antiporter subunit B
MRPSLILRTAARFLLVLLLLFSIFELLRGHNEPGGGFIGGLLAAGGFGLYLLAYDARKSARLLRFGPLTLIAAGLLMAAAAGSAGLLAGESFLQGLWYPRPVPGIGKVSTVLVFDIGVYLVVLGTALLILFTLAEKVERAED